MSALPSTPDTGATPRARTRTRAHARAQRGAEFALLTLVPLIAALVVGALIMWALGAHPLEFYADVLRFGLSGNAWQQTLIAMAPLLLIALGLIVSFRAGLWNLSYTGTYLLAAAVVAGIAPGVTAALPFGLAVTTLIAASVALGAGIGLIPAWLKNRNGANEVVSSLMVSFVAMGLASLLVRGPFQDPAVTVPQTRVLDLESMLPFLPGTSVHAGFAISLVVLILAHYLLTRTPFGLRVDLLGANPRAARHAGVNTKRLTLAVFALSGAAFALAATVDMLGLWGYMRADFNPTYGDLILPFVFLARLNPLGSVPFVAFFAVFSTGGTLAAQRAGLSVDVLLVIVALVLFFMVLTEYFARRRATGLSYLPGLSGARGHDDH